MEKWHNYRSPQSDENISLLDAQKIRDYCKKHSLPVPELSVHMPGSAGADALTEMDYSVLNKFPTNEPVYVLGKWAHTTIELRQVQIALSNVPGDAKYPGWAKFSTLARFALPNSKTDSELVLHVLHNNPAAEKAFFGIFEEKA